MPGSMRSGSPAPPRSVCVRVCGCSDGPKCDDPDADPAEALPCRRPHSTPNVVGPEHTHGPDDAARDLERIRAAWQAVLRLRVLAGLRDDPRVEEASALTASLCQALAPGDALVTSHRVVAHAVARGVPGSTFANAPIVSAPHRFFGGEGPGLALSLALAAAMHAHPRVTVYACDGAQPAQAELEQTLELAAVWSLPMVFVAGWTPADDGPAPWVARDVEGLRTVTLDCDDALALCRTLSATLDGVRRGESPCLIAVRCRPGPQAALASLEDELRRHGGLTDDDRSRVEARLAEELRRQTDEEVGALVGEDLPPRGPVQ